MIDDARDDRVRTRWQAATVVGIKPETANAKSFRLALSEPSRHLAGQHYVVRLTAPDGYTASRSYSVASAPDESNEIELTVERMVEGEVSSFLHEVAEVGDELELRGPIGRWFVWNGDSRALLIGGGSGIVPLMAMLRLARCKGTTDLLRLVVAVRTPADLYYADEVLGPETTIAYTRAAPKGYPRRPSYLDAFDFPNGIEPGTTAYICGSPAFVDAATDVVTGIGFPPSDIRTERFGPTG